MALRGRDEGGESRVIVMNEVERGLWQAGRRHLPGPEGHPEVDVVLRLTPHAAPRIGSAIEIALPFDDSLAGLDAVRFDALVGLCWGLRGRRVLTMCEEGKNRSGLASALVLIARGRTVGEAIALVRGTCSKPGSVVALSNQTFVRQLEERFG